MVQEVQNRLIVIPNPMIGSWFDLPDIYRMSEDEVVVFHIICNMTSNYHFMSFLLMTI